jgi:hypothetical protein
VAALVCSPALLPLTSQVTIYGWSTRSLLKLADCVRVVISAEADVEAWSAGRRAGAEGWAVAAVTRRGVPATLARAGRVWW